MPSHVSHPHQDPKRSAGQQGEPRRISHYFDDANKFQGEIRMTGKGSRPLLHAAHCLSRGAAAATFMHAGESSPASGRYNAHTPARRNLALNLGGALRLWGVVERGVMATKGGGTARGGKVQIRYSASVKLLRWGTLINISNRC